MQKTRWRTIGVAAGLAVALAGSLHGCGLAERLAAGIGAGEEQAGAGTDTAQAPGGAAGTGMGDDASRKDGSSKANGAAGAAGADSGGAEAGKRLAAGPDEASTGTLVLVNRDHGMQPEAGELDLVRLSKQPGDLRLAEGAQDAKLSREAADRFAELVAAAREDGVDGLVVNSAYRSVQEQERLYREQGPDYALPAGHSEHNTGLALDVGSVYGRMESAEEGRWMREHAWQHGFILRYPEDKTEVTGIQYEPWHFRYVGLPHSEIIQERGLALEEYIELLREEKELRVESLGETYSILWQEARPGGAVSVAKGSAAARSGDNAGGVIVTSRREEGAG
ncbi:M15 family metallopeptidase [Paenibacillus albicereus]|uniref:M15 family metallopeptidase n=1 Tax=Paenibacillus albicereus TaxID=2726185 RepID=A0A6H2GYZ1_9BACL|nr:M15 family metallopeptidase [Paenibacillus albicereus]QJC52612.1 M15 family metallopeptidase [Paenibacillus albicereus]